MLLLQVNLQNSSPTAPGSGNLLGLLFPLNLVESVPNLIGLSQTAAVAALAASGFVPGLITIGNSATFPAGLVIAQSPVANAIIPDGSAVNFVLSSGLGGIGVMPNLIGLPLVAAEFALEVAHILVPPLLGYFGVWPITVIWVRQTQPIVTIDGLQGPVPFPGCVIAQSILPGVTVKPNTPITLTVVQPTIPIAYPGTNLMSS